MKQNQDERQQIVGDTVYRYSAAWINTLETEDHWRLYWQQQKLIQTEVKPGQQVLEIGPGSGFTTNYLRAKGVYVTTMDIDDRKSPDIVANVVTFDWSQLQVDHILAFEVFEHIPFHEFKILLTKLSAVCRHNCFISLPLAERILLRMDIRLPKLGTKQIKIALPKTLKHQDHHYWEVGASNTSLKVLQQVFSSAGFRVIHTAEKLSRLFFKLQSPHH